MQTPSSAYTEWPTIVQKVIQTIQNYGLVIWVLLFALIALASLLKLTFNPWLFDKLQFILDKMQVSAYKSFAQDASHHHRVTLFKYHRFIAIGRRVGRRYCSPWGKGIHPWTGWLRPILRSGITSQYSKTAFPVPDDGDRAEGVAGQAWVSNYTTIVQDLPQITSDSSAEDVEEYAKKTFCPTNYVDGCRAAGKILPRSLAAIPIWVRGKPWGVLVLDSRHPEGVKEETVMNFSVTVEIISQLLEKA